jgi:hypothetical protein
MMMTGEDPSTKKEDELFLIDLGSEAELRDALLPAPDFPEAVAKSLIDGMMDVVGLPGGFHGDDSGGSDLSLMGDALSELANQGRTRLEGAGRTDLQWKSLKRTAIRQVKNLPSLIKRVRLYDKLRLKVTQNTIKAFRNACKRAGWTDQARIESWAHRGFITRIIRDTFENYLSLHQHLLGLCTAGAPWEYAQVELEHHVEELEIIRNTQDSRLQALCALYAYLRDGASVNWHSASLQYKRNLEMFVRPGE